MGDVAVLWNGTRKEKEKSEMNNITYAPIRIVAYRSKNQLTPAISLEVSTTITLVDSASFRVASRMIVDFPDPVKSRV